MKGFGSSNPSEGNRDRLENLVDVFEWPNEYARVRMIGPVYSYAHVWFTIRTKTKPRQAIPKLCLDHDGDSDKMVTEVCPYRKSGAGRVAKQYAINVIVRDLQVDSKGRELDFPVPRGEREKVLGYPAYWGSKGDTRKTPVRIFVIPESVATKIKKMMALNKGKDENGKVRPFELSDIKYGCDIDVMIDPDKKGAAKYDVQKADRTPLTAEERKYLLYRPDLLKPESLGEAKREMKDLETKLVEDDKDKKRRSRDDDDDEEPRKKRRSRDDDDDVDDEVIDAGDLDDDDDEEEPRKKRRSRDEDDEDEEEPRKRKRSRDDDDDDDEEPRSKHKRKQEEDDDDDDVDLDSLDDDSDDDDEDEKPRKRRAADDDDEEEPRKKRRSRVEDDDDEDDDDEDDDSGDDDDDEDEKPRKRRR